MNLSQLRFANAVATAGSFTSAAAQCCVTQPTLSNSIAQLEAELGERLFVRTTRKVALTAFGTHLLPFIEQALNAVAILTQQTQIFLAPDKQLIRIGTSPLLNTKFVRFLIESFRLQHPHVNVILREMNMTDLYRLLNESHLDFVFGIVSDRKSNLDSTFLYEEPLRFIPSGGVRPAGLHLHAVQLKDIATETYVMVPDSCGLARATRALFRSHRRKLREYAGEAMGYQVLEDWAGLGIGAAILPKSKLSSPDNITFSINDKFGQEVTLGFEAIWSRSRNQAGHCLNFIEHLRNIAPNFTDGLETLSPQVSTTFSSCQP